MGKKSKDKKDRKERKDKKDRKAKKAKTVRDPPKVDLKQRKERKKDPKRKSEKKQRRKEKGSVAEKPNRTMKVEVPSSNGEEFRKENRIKIFGEAVDPFLAFSATGFSSDLLQITSGFEKPTPIQSQTWPYLIAKKDVVGVAETGSGKTIAFGLPGASYIKDNSRLLKPLVLIIAPTRELAQQNHDVLEKVGKNCNFKTACIYGGVPKYTQYNALRNAQLVVACPGRLIDLSKDGKCDLSKIGYLVLDEADRMLDMGFEADIRYIIGQTPSTRQTVMFSATWPEAVRNLAKDFLSPQFIRVTVGSDKLSANVRIQQIVEVIEMEKRDARLLELLKDYHSQQKEKLLLFGLYKKEASRLERYLSQRGWNCISIHGDKSTKQRAEALQAFKTGRVPLLIATDVAARGLDIPKVEYVINYSFPLTIEDYIHRIGRTGRAGRTGISHTFFHKWDKARSGELIGVLRKAKMPVPEELMKFGVGVKKKEPKLGKINTDIVSASHVTFSDSDSE